MHIGGDDEFGAVAQANFTSDQMFGDDTHDMSASGQCCLGHGPHQPDAATPENQFDPGIGKNPAEPRGLLPVEARPPI